MSVSLKKLTPFLGIIVALSFSSSTWANSPEENCIEELVQQAQSSPLFSGINLTKARKLNGDSRKSREFDISSYQKFKDIANLPIPSKRNKIQYFPDRLDRVSNKTAANRTYKSNRNNVGTILYQDGTNTDIKVWEGSQGGLYKTHQIDGYYLDTKVVTFGQKTDFRFPFPAREDYAPREWPFGSPYDDMRQYLMYTHHLTPAKEPNANKRFSSCGLVKISPDGRYNISGLTPNEYGGNVFNGSGYTTSTLTKDGDQFRKGIVKIQAVDTSFVPGNSTVNGHKYLHFDVLTLAYNNGSSFLNEYTTLEIQKNNMTEPSDQRRGMNEVIENFYNSIPNNLAIKSGSQAVDTLSSTDTISKSLLASSFSAEKSTDKAPKKAGLALFEGTSFDLVQEVKQIEDPELKQYLYNALIPGMNEVYKKTNPENRSDFENKYLSCSLSSQDKIDNVQHLIDINKGGANLTLDTLEYNNLEFGECVIPFRDARKTKILENKVFSEDESELKTKFDEQMSALKAKFDEDIKNGILMSIASQELEIAQAALQTKYAQDLLQINKLQKAQQECAIAKLEFDVEAQNSSLPAPVLEAKKKTLINQCNISLNEFSVGLESVVEPEKVTEVINKIEQEDLSTKYSFIVPEKPAETPIIKEPVQEEPEPISLLEKYQLVYKILAGVFVLLALFLIVRAFRRK